MSDNGRPAEIGIHFGALSPPIGEQLIEQGFMADEKHSSVQWQADVDAIIRLYLRGIVTDGEKQKAQGRLFKAIKAGVKVVDGVR